jgi:ureidoacrylate peracid hydrolase
MSDKQDFGELKAKYQELETKFRKLESRYRDLQSANDVIYRARLANYRPPSMKYPSRISRDYMDFLLAPEKTALLVIDMQNLFCAPGGQLYVPHYADIIPAINKLVKFFRGVDIPIVWIRGVSEKDFSDRGLMEWRYDRNRITRPHTSDSWEAQFHKELDGPLPGDIVIDKHKRDVFQGSYINSTLKFFGIESLVLTGVATDSCVGSAASSANSMDYNAIIVVDAVAARTKQRQEAFLERIEESRARLMTSEEVLAELKALALPAGFKSIYIQRRDELKAKQDS